MAAVSVLAMAASSPSRSLTTAVASTNPTGYEEIPTLSTSGTGSFTARLNNDEDEIAYTLSYQTSSTRTQPAVPSRRRTFTSVRAYKRISAFLAAMTRR